MITKEFRRWAEDIKDMIGKRIYRPPTRLAYAWMNEVGANIIHVGIDFLEGQRFWMSFDQEEFNRNNKEQRCSMAEIRRKDMTRTIEDFIETLTKTVKVLK